MVVRYKNKGAQQMFDRAVSKCTFPATLEKDGIGGSYACAFNAGYKGTARVGIHRYHRGSAGFILYYAGKEKSRLDKIANRTKNGASHRVPNK